MTSENMVSCDNRTRLELEVKYGVEKMPFVSLFFPMNYERPTLLDFSDRKPRPRSQNTSFARELSLGKADADNVDMTCNRREETRKAHSLLT